MTYVDRAPMVRQAVDHAAALWDVVRDLDIQGIREIFNHLPRRGVETMCLVFAAAAKDAPTAGDLAWLDEFYDADPTRKEHLT